jgi:multiple sugar transport system substrate-binding protein
MRTRMAVRFLSLLAVSLTFVACVEGPRTVVVEKTTPVVVEKKVTVVVEKVVTPIPVLPPSAEVYLLSTASSPLEGALLEQCRVTYRHVEYTVLDEMIRAGQESFIFYAYPTTLLSLVQDKAVVPLDELLGIEKDEYIGVLVEALTYDDKVYGIPRSFDAMALFYNVDLFDQAGVETPHNDWTWDDLRAAARAISENVGVPGFVVDSWYGYLAVFVLRNGGQIMSEDFTETMLDYPEAIGAGEFYTGARQVEGWAILPKDAGVSSTREAFGQGIVAMTIDGYAATRTLPSSYPDLNYGVVQPPVGPHGKEGNLVFATGYAVSDSSDPEAILAAKAAVACLTSEPIQRALVKSARVLPSRQSLEADLRDDPTADILFAGAEYATSYGLGPRHSEVSTAIWYALDRIYYEGSTVKDSFQEAAEAIRQIIAE